MRALYVILFLSCWQLVFAQSDPETFTGEKPRSAEEVLSLFIKRISTNYPQFPSVHSTFISESEKLVDGTILCDNSATVEYFRGTYIDHHEDRMKVIGNDNNVEAKGGHPGIFGGLGEIKKDLIKYPREFLWGSNYRYSLTDTSINENKVYKVIFNPGKKCRFQGQLYIDVFSLALIKAEYSLSPYGLSLLNRLQSLESFEWRDITVLVEYKRPESPKYYFDDNNKYHLATITTTSTGFHYYYGQESSITTKLAVADVNRTTFFANEYGLIDDRIALADAWYYVQDIDVGSPKYERELEGPLITQNNQKD